MKSTSQRKRKYNLKFRYGITPQTYAAMRRAQQGLCAICDRSSKLHVDHIAGTKFVRGLLCHGCNTAIGLFGERPELLGGRAAHYLGFHRARFEAWCNSHIVG